MVVTGFILEIWFIHQAYSSSIVFFLNKIWIYREIKNGKIKLFKAFYLLKENMPDI